MVIIGWIVLSFFALIGAAAFVSALLGGSADEQTALVLEKLTVKDAEMRVRRAASMCDRIRCQRLICRCVDEDAEHICEHLMREYRIIEIQSG